MNLSLQINVKAHELIWLWWRDNYANVVGSIPTYASFFSQLDNRRDRRILEMVHSRKTIEESSCRTTVYTSFCKLTIFVTATKFVYPQQWIHNSSNNESISPSKWLPSSKTPDVEEKFLTCVNEWNRWKNPVADAASYFGHKLRCVYTEQYHTFSKYTYIRLLDNQFESNYIQSNEDPLDRKLNSKNC